MSDSDKTDRRKFLGGLLGVPLLAGGRSQGNRDLKAKMKEIQQNIEDIKKRIAERKAARDEKLQQIRNATGPNPRIKTLTPERKAELQAQWDERQASIDRLMEDVAASKKRLAELRASRNKK